MAINQALRFEPLKLLRCIGKTFSTVSVSIMEACARPCRISVRHRLVGPAYSLTSPETQNHSTPRCFITLDRSKSSSSSCLSAARYTLYTSKAFDRVFEFQMPEAYTDMVEAGPLTGAKYSA